MNNQIFKTKNRRIYSTLCLLMLFSICSFAQEVQQKPVKMIKKSKQVKNQTTQERPMPQKTKVMPPKRDQVSVTTDESADHFVKQPLVLNQKSQNAKVLFEKTHKVSLTDDQYIQKINSTQENLTKWEEVLTAFKKDSTVDLSIVQTMVKAMKQKLP